MGILVAVVFGAVIGWGASVLLRTSTSEGILLDVAAGFLGSLPAASLLGHDFILDSLLAGGLGALMGVAVLNLVRFRLAPSSTRSPNEQP
ncbi:hypothetical protein GCM10023264_11890 [Sphingomonas daechungensis]|uniref:GlsB/YeaQ/YmgE family stress response membrane protein n=1 Tax=Sphingomonas daechungensis TaxID=1176646 RepID=A0ABX6T0X5_9SPHN|nr:GlsB/YeaQ/YmgE family stress response membrane protein [Sphingomonas daechungensis]QNP42383.1 GlsB/YeaQ/YmgE family stress response membrane protein [Sphingomonas daechungensis]